MEILENIEIIDLCLYLRKEKVLVIGDIHIGLEEALQKQGFLIPRFDIQEVIKRLKSIFSKVEVKKIILIGDVKHEFGTISDQEWRDTLKVLDFLLEKGKVILIKGNHDTILGPISKKRGIEVIEKYKVNGILLVHGDKIINDDSKIIVIGHEHPAISFKPRPDEKFKCFLVGRYKNKKLIIIPSFNFLNEGNDVTKEEILSPYIKNIKNFRVYVVEDRVRSFELVKNLE
ncbi:metallophosphoesterase [Candidatus Woesearchaeota archaeon]|nr:metallophosphoesterase [Candidatus Woesearchaeota archaeon]